MSVAVKTQVMDWSKFTAEDFNRITGWQGRTNQEQRDAGMLIWGMK